MSALKTSILEIHQDVSLRRKIEKQKRLKLKG